MIIPKMIALPLGYKGIRESLVVNATLLGTPDRIRTDMFCVYGLFGWTTDSRCVDPERMRSA